MPKSVHFSSYYGSIHLNYTFYKHIFSGQFNHIYSSYLELSSITQTDCTIQFTAVTKCYYRIKNWAKDCQIRSFKDLINSQRQWCCQYLFIYQGFFIFNLNFAWNILALQSPDDNLLIGQKATDFSLYYCHSHCLFINCIGWRAC